MALSQTLEQLADDLAGQVGAQLKVVREEYGLTQADLAWRCQKLGFRWLQPEIARLENEGVRSLAQVVALARALPCHPLQLLQPILSEKTKAGQVPSRADVDAIGEFLNERLVKAWHQRHTDLERRLRGLEAFEVLKLADALGELAVLDRRSVDVMAGMVIAHAAALRRQASRASLPVPKQGRYRRHLTSKGGSKKS
jgi:transcriptional regulator with XRE-family HTH domain